MKKFLLLFGFFLSVLLGCSPESKGNKGVDSEDTQWRLTVDGKPFLMLGAQLRTDFFRDLDGKSLDELDTYFSLAASLNITVVQIAFSWRAVEPDYNVYTDEAVRAYIDYCEKYGLKAEFLWFGSYMCGYSVEGHLPPYVVEDNKTYPEVNPAAWYQGWQGKQYYLKPGNSNLLAREAKAIGKMMEFIDAYDKQLGRPHTVIGIQIENEPDMLATRHNDHHKVAASELWPSIVAHLDVVGKAVKSSPYKCYTRVNLTLDDYASWAGVIAKREGIDYVGLDPYVADVDRLEDLLTFLKSIPGNFAHIAENGGEYYNNDVLTLKALSMGCGYEVFEVVTTPDPQLKDWTLRGVYNPDFTPKGQTQRLIDAYGIFKGAWYDFATAPVASIAGFNIRVSSGQEKTQTAEVATLPSVSVSWTTTSRGIAYAIEGRGYVTVGSTRADKMEFSVTPQIVEEGRYDKDGKWVSGTLVPGHLKGSVLSLEPCKVYRVQL